MPESTVAAHSHRHAPLIAAIDSDEQRPKRKANSDRHQVEFHPRTASRYVESLRDRVVHALASLGYPPLDAVDCEVAAGRVVLSGCLPSYHLKQMAQVAALRVAGAGHVDNQVVVTTL
jgi:hypothetical protein